MLGALMEPSASYTGLLDLLQPTDFFVPRHRAVLELIRQTTYRYGQPNILLVSAEAERIHHLTITAAYLRSLVALVIHDPNLTHAYATLLRDTANCRAALIFAQRLTRIAYGKPADYADALVALDPDWTALIMAVAPDGMTLPGPQGRQMLGGVPV